MAKTTRKRQNARDARTTGLFRKLLIIIPALALAIYSVLWSLAGSSRNAVAVAHLPVAHGLMLAQASNDVLVQSVRQSEQQARPADGVGKTDNLTAGNAPAAKGQNTVSVPPAAIELAHRAWKADPVTPAALRVMALGLANEGKMNAARKLMKNALAISRRDEVTSMWLLGDYARQADQRNTLKMINIILKTDPQSGSFLLPLMASGLTRPGSVPEYVRLLSTKPGWSDNFWKQVWQTPETMLNAASVRMELAKREGRTSFNGNDRDMVIRLVSNGHYAEAENYFQRITGSKGRGKAIVRNADFSHQPVAPPLDWQLDSSANSGALVREQDKLLEVSSIADTGGRVARQLIRLNRGSYELQISIAGKDMTEGRAPMRVRLNCAGASSRQSVFFDVKRKQFRARFNQQLDCQYFYLDLEVLPEGLGNSQSLLLDRVDIVPVSASAPAPEQR